MSTYSETNCDHVSHSPSLASEEQENLENTNQAHITYWSNDPQNESHAANNVQSVRSKEEYSACIKLIEKFQDAVLDNAVRIIQAAFKRFRERRRFLKLRKAATVIQRNVRRWLQLRYSCLQPELQSDDCDSDNGIEMRKPGLSPDSGLSEVSPECLENKEDRKCSDELAAGVSGNNFSENLIKEDLDSYKLNYKLENETQEELCESALGRCECTVLVQQFDSSCDGLDRTSCQSTEDVNQLGIYSDHNNASDNPFCVTEPDALSLTDSGIDMGFDTGVETVIKDNSQCPSDENDPRHCLDQMTDGCAS